MMLMFFYFTSIAKGVRLITILYLFFIFENCVCSLTVIFRGVHGSGWVGEFFLTQSKCSGWLDW